jgi:hypothetical protein
MEQMLLDVRYCLQQAADRGPFWWGDICGNDGGPLLHLQRDISEGVTTIHLLVYDIPTTPEYTVTEATNDPNIDPPRYANSFRRQLLQSRQQSRSQINPQAQLPRLRRR